MKIEVPDPEGLVFQEWAALLAEAATPLIVELPAGTFPESSWKSWAVNLFFTQEFAAGPNPVYYDSWELWAVDLAAAL